MRKIYAVQYHDSLGYSINSVSPHADGSGAYDYVAQEAFWFKTREAAELRLAEIAREDMAAGNFVEVMKPTRYTPRHKHRSAR